jgi:serine/threonine protein phosphatase 1
MATIAVGDIHGNFPALTDVLDQLGREVVEGDVVVFLEDYIDRGRDSKACVEAILSFRMRFLPGSCVSEVTTRTGCFVR